MVSTWRQIQIQNFVSWEKLSLFLQLDKNEQEILVKSSFPLNLPLRLAEKIQKQSLDDPILKQFLPLTKELLKESGFKEDPVGDASFKKESKLIQKYQGRALLVVSSACAMHCRYCFRKNFSYEVSRKDFLPELAVIEKDASLHEIILSGGDPLSLGNEELKKLLESLDKIPHIKRIRFHTRFPIGIPERIDEPFLKILEEMTKQIIFVIHSNHPKELDSTIFSSLKKIQKLGIPILNQSVLLKGINDSLDTLKELFETLSDHGILPYYLHQLDKVSGAGHFEVDESKGKSLMKELSKVLSGYSLPKYSKEEQGHFSKTIIFHET